MNIAPSKHAPFLRQCGPVVIKLPASRRRHHSLPRASLAATTLESDAARHATTTRVAVGALEKQPMRIQRGRGVLGHGGSSD